MAGFSTLIFLVFYLRDTYIRVWAVDKIKYIRWLKNTDYWRVLIFLITLLISVWLNLFITYTQQKIIFSYLNCAFMVFFTSWDFFQTAFCTKTHVQLMSTCKYYFAFIIATIGAFLAFVNWITFIVLTIIHGQEINGIVIYTLFWIIFVSIYLVTLIILEINHFIYVYHNSFINESAVNPGIRAFWGMVSRPTFRFTHCCIRFMIVIIWFIFGYKYDYDMFYLIIYPLTICVWNVSSFFQRTANRPKPRGCCLTIWKKYIECLYHKANARHLRLNPRFQAKDVDW